MGEKAVPDSEADNPSKSGRGGGAHLLISLINLRHISFMLHPRRLCWKSKSCPSSSIYNITTDMFPNILKYLSVCISQRNMHEDISHFLFLVPIFAALGEIFIKVDFLIHPVSLPGDELLFVF